MRKKSVCPSCNHEFEYECSTGQTRLYCSNDCEKAGAALRRKQRAHIGSPCKTEGCNGVVTARVGSALCEACYMRLYRNGSTYKRIPRGWHEGPDGYIVYFKKGHPLAGKRGMIRAHRYIAYEHYGPGAHPCAYCGKTMGWEDISIDHVNNDKTDNRIENLAISCNKCNRMKGAMSAMISVLTDDGVELLINSIHLLREQIRESKTGNSLTDG